MKEFLIIINQSKVILAVLLIGVGLFYWFQIRPSRICSICYQKAIEEAIVANNEWSIKGIMEEHSLNSPEDAIIYLANPNYEQKAYEHFFSRCFRERGINK